jgi:hypothetical protein
VSKKKKGPTPKKHRIKLTVIPEPEKGTRTVFAPGTPGMTFFRGPDRNIELVCGSCEHVLVAGMKTSQFQGIVFQCANCGAYNESLQ